MILADFLDLFETYPALWKFFMFIILMGLALGICLSLGIKDIVIIMLFYAIIVITLYAFGVISILWATSGYIIGIVVTYFTTKSIGGSNNAVR